MSILDKMLIRDIVLIFFALLVCVAVSYVVVKTREYRRGEKDWTPYHRNDLMMKLGELMQNSPTAKELNEWIKIAEFLDKIYFEKHPEFRNFEPTANIFRRVLSPDKYPR